MGRQLWSAAVLLSVVGAACTACRAQDSVALSPGGNDALSSFDASVQRTRYVVDLVQTTTGWNNPILVGPVSKASRDTNPLFKTQVLGSITVSPNLATGLSFAQKSYSSWSAPGAGVSPTNNSAPGSLSATAFNSQFALALSDFSLQPSSIVGATVGRAAGQFNRLYVERVVAASSRSTDVSTDTSTVSLGGVTAFGDLALRADNFNTSPTTTTRILGENIARINLAARGSGVNTLFSSSGVNSADDTGATTYVIDNETTPTNTPTILNQAGVGPFVLIYDLGSHFRPGSNEFNVISTTTHLNGLGVSGHRGNPTYSPISVGASTAGAVASIALPNGSIYPSKLNIFGLNFGSGGSIPTITPASRAAYLLPTPVTNGAYTTNTSGQAAFKQYLSQVPWRGGNGQVAIGQNASSQIMLAATASDPSNGDFIAVATVTASNTAAWTIAAYPGQPVLNGPSGTQIGAIPTVGAAFSAPALDKLGNVYFVATWKPSLTPQEVAVFKAVNTTSGYKLEPMLRQGLTIVGADSTRPYTISSIKLNDSDSIASGTMFSQSVIQQQDPAATTSDPTKVRAFGGLVVSAVISYDNGGVSEPYEAVLYVGPTQGNDCPADFNNSGSVTVQDLFDFLAAWFAHCDGTQSGSPCFSRNADFNHSGAITVQDLFDFLAAWFAHC